MSRKTFIEDQVIGLIAWVIMMLIIAIPVWLAYRYDEYRCDQYAQVMKLEHQYSWTTRCMVKTSRGTWVPLSAVREVTP